MNLPILSSRRSDKAAAIFWADHHRVLTLVKTIRASDFNNRVAD